MPADATVAQALVETYSEEEIRGLRKVALEVRMEGGTTTRNYEGSSMTIDINNAGQIIDDCSAALQIIAATAAGNDPSLVRGPVNSGIDFSRRRVQ